VAEISFFFSILCKKIHLAHPNPSEPKLQPTSKPN